MLDPRRSKDLLKVPNKWLVLEISMELDTSWMSKCMDFPKILPQVPFQRDDLHGVMVHCRKIGLF